MAIQLANITLAAPQTLVSAGLIAQLYEYRRAALIAEFSYGSGGTSVDAYVQSTIDGVNWYDVANFHFTTSSGKTAFNLQSDTSVINQATLTNGTLAANTCVDGLLGTGLQVFWQSSGTYSDSTLLVYAVTTPQN